MQAMIDDYFLWLRDKTILKKVKDQSSTDWIRITTPHLDRHNDCLQIYAQETNSKWTLTDDGSTIEDIVSSGCKMESPKRKRLLEQTIASLGVQLGASGEDLFVHATPENFPIKKHSLIQAMLAVNDLFYLAQSNVMSLFYEDVVAWLNASDVRFTPNVKFTGKSGYDHMFDFVIPKFKNVPERFVQALANPNKSSVTRAVYSWMDTKDTRETGSKLYVFMNDLEHTIKADDIDALKNYDAVPVLWSERNTVQAELVA